MRNCLILILILLTAPFTCGFDWGFGSKDKCGDAKRLVNELAVMKTTDEGAAVKARIVTLCPEGAAGHYVRGLDLEMAGDGAGAAVEYGEALKSDPDFPLASGNLGLIHLQQGLQDDAVVELTRALEAVSESRYHRGLGDIFNDHKLYPLALYHYNQVAKALPSDGAIHGALASTYALMGRLDNAEEEYSRALALAPGNLGAQLGLAEILIRKDAPDRAVAELQKALRAHPANRNIHWLLARAYEKKAEWKAAEDEYLLAGVEQGKKPSLYVGRIRQGDEHLAKNEYDKAIAEYRGALKEKPDASEALQKLGDAFMAKGSDDDALFAYHAALHDKPDNGLIHYNLGRVYDRKGLLDEAVVEYRQTLKLMPEKLEARRRLAEIYTTRGSFSQAVEQYQELVKAEKDDGEVHRKLARAYLSNRNSKAAADEFREAVRLDPANLNAHLELANLYRKNNQFDEAVTQYREVLRLKKDDSEARNALTAIFVKNKSYDELITLLKQNTELAPNDPNSHYKLGLVYEFKKNYPEAEASYKAATVLKSDHAKALNSLGRVYMKTGRLKEAKVALEAARAADPALEETTVLLSNIREEFAPQRTKHARKKWHKSKKGKSAKKAKKTKKGKRGKKSSTGKS